MIKTSTKDIHSFLNGKRGLVVHFSGCSKGAGLGRKLFPEDLKDVLSGNILGALSCSVVIPGDDHSSEPTQRDALGSIGLILDVDGSNLSAISHMDAGSHVDEIINRLSEVKDLTINDLEKPLSNRITYNEWVIKPYDIKGIFIFNPDCILIRRMVPMPDSEGVAEGNFKISLQDVCELFPACEIFTFVGGKVAKLDLTANIFRVLTENLYG